MKKSRLIEIFVNLSRSEQRELGKFVKAPMFNQRRDVSDLYEYLYRKFPFKKSNIVEKEVVFRQIFPNEKYDKKKMDYTISFLFQVVKDYLAFKEFSSNPINNQTYLLRALRKRKLSRIFETEINITQKLIENHDFRNFDFHYFNYRFYLEKYRFNQSQSRLSSDGFQEFSDEFSNYSIANYLWQACCALSQKKVSQADFQLELLPEILNHISKNDYSEVPAVNIYYHCYKSLTEENALPWFEKLEQLIETHNTAFPKAELRDIYMIAINYCIAQFNAGKKEYIQKAFEFYKKGLEFEALIENGFLSRFTYHNIALSGMVLTEFDWVESFIFNYKNKIEETYRENTFSYNLATLYYRKSDYKKAMQLLQTVDLQDIHWNLNARRMLLKIYFEQEEREALESLLTSFKNFIYRRKELGGNHKSNNLNLIKFVQKRLIIGDFDKEGLAALKKEVEAEKAVADRAWLLGVISPRNRQF